MRRCLRNVKGTMVQFHSKCYLTAERQSDERCINKSVDAGLLAAGGCGRKFSLCSSGL